MKRNNFIKFILIPILFLFGLSLLAAFISFSKSDHIILGGDLYYPLDPQLDVSRTLFAWDERYATGQTSEGRHIPSFLFFLFFSFLSKLSIPLFVSQKIAIFLIFSLTAPAMYYLILVVRRFQQKEVSFRTSLVAFFGAFFYNFNLWNLFNWSAPSVHLQISYLAAPLILAFFIQGIRKKSYFYAILIALISVLFTPAASNPIYILNIFWPVVFFVVFFLIRKAFLRDWESFFSSLVFSLVTAIIFILINLWWMLPMVETLKNSVGTISNSNSFWEWLNQKSERSSFLNIFRLVNHEAWKHSISGNLIIASACTYIHNMIFVVLSFIFPFLAFLKLLQRKNRFFVLYFSIMAVTMIFLAKGVHMPLGNINEFLHQKILIFKLYRSIEWYTPMIVLSLAYLIGEGALFVYDFLIKLKKARKARLSIFALICVFFVYSYPFWVGKVVHQGIEEKEIANSYFVKIPSWYFESANWINMQKENFRIMSLPSLALYYHTNWGFSGGELGTLLLDKPIINNTFGKGVVKDLSFSMINLLADRNNNESKDFTHVLGLMNAKYAILRRDAADWYSGENKMKEPDLSLMSERLNKSSGLSIKKTIGDLTFFENNNFLPKIYIPQEIIISQRPLNDFFRIVSDEDWKMGSAVFFEEQNQNKTEHLKKLRMQLSDEKATPTLEFKKINPTKYRIRVHSATGEFPLIFSENFHDGWKSYLVKPDEIQLLNFKTQTLNKSQISDYKILDGNDENQANKEDLGDFIQRGWVTSLGDQKEKTIEHMKWNENEQKRELDYMEKYSIDFISKKIQGTIQNDNLPEGDFWEIWSASESDIKSASFIQDDNIIELSEKNHLIANGYANGWLINASELCQQLGDQDPKANDGFCIRNPDGSYDFEMIVEFWPQRLLYVGAGMSLTTLLSCITYLLYNWRRKKHGTISKNL